MRLTKQVRHDFRQPWTHTSSLALFIMLLFVALFTSCSNEDLENTELEPQEVNVNLVVSLNGKVSTSTSGENDAIGNEYMISEKDFVVLLYKTNGEFRSKVVITGCKKLSYNEYALEGKFLALTKAELNNNLKMVVIANAQNGTCKIAERSWQSNISESQLYSELNYSYDAAKAQAFTANIVNPASDCTEGIPMWGSLTTLIVNHGSYKINLERAMAKVTVSMGDKVSGKKIKAVKLNNCGTEGGLMTPKNAASSQQTYEVNKDNGNSELNTPNNAQEPFEDIPFVTYEKDGKTYFCLYIPEQKAYNESGVKMTVTIEDEDENTEDYNLYFADYSSNGSTPDTYRPILRNNWYDYVITGVTAKTIQVNLNYYVADWTAKAATNITFD